MESIGSSNSLGGHRIKEGDSVIIKKLHDKTFGRLVEIDAKCSLFIGKIKFNISAILGKEFGSIYMINNKTKCLEFVEKFDELFDFKSALDELKDRDVERDNRSIVDDNKSQKLTTSDIKTFRDDGLTTKEIIETIVENSSTFNQKTVYSQEKYLKKKQEKYSNYLRVYKPNANLLCDMWYSQGAYKTANVRIDSLAQMLNLCNVRSGCKYMIVDNYFGLISAAVLERLIGDGTVFDKLNSGQFEDVGKCVQIITDHGPVSSWRMAIDALNFKEEHRNHCLLSIQIHKTIPILRSVDETSVTIKTIKNSVDQSNDSSAKTSQQYEKVKTEDPGDELEDEFRKIKRAKFEERALRKQKRTVEENTAYELLSKRNFDGLIVVLRNQNVTELVDHLLHFLAPSGQFVIFSEFIEPLTQCYNDLKQKACNFRLSESWMRDLQILPMRSRPEVDMSGKSGFLLHAIKLCSEN